VLLLLLPLPLLLLPLLLLPLPLCSHCCSGPAAQGAA
jgi:hypothetical protein